jgi:hypothetical protein
MEDFLSWFPGYYITIAETGTKLFWAVVLNWFAVGVLHVVPSLNLDKTEKITRKVNNISWLTSARNCRGKTLRAKKMELIRTNHKITDWAISFLEATHLIAGLFQNWQPRLCMLQSDEYLLDDEEDEDNEDELLEYKELEVEPADLTQNGLSGS